MKPPVNESTKCTQFIRAIPLAQFRLPSDGRKWQQAARTRKNFLIYLSAWANGDGSFVGATGIDYSPSEKTITRHMNRKTYYRVSEALRQLGLLSWTRKQTHYGRRSFTIHLENHSPHSPKTGDIFKQEQVSHSKETGDLFTKITGDTFAGTHPHDGTVITHPHDGTQSVLPITASANRDNQRTDSATVIITNAGARSQTDAAAGAIEAVVVSADSSKMSPAGHLPSNPTLGGECLPSAEMGVGGAER